jgi:hypothetical protein
MNMNTLLTTIRDAIHDNSATQTWCTANYTRNHKVYVGIDTREPPNEDAYPIVHLFPMNKIEGYSLEEQQHGMGVTCGIHNATLRTTGKTNVVEYTGMQDIETFRKLVEAAITGTAIADIRIDSLNIDYETVEFFPFFLANMEVNFVHDYAQGDGVWD